jgi:hypothetical protein
MQSPVVDHNYCTLWYIITGCKKNKQICSKYRYIMTTDVLFIQNVLSLAFFRVSRLFLIYLYRVLFNWCCYVFPNCCVCLFSIWIVVSMTTVFHWCCFVDTDCCFTGFVMSITTAVSLVLFRLYRLLFHWLCYVYHDCCFTCVVSFVDIIVILTVNLNDNLLMMGASVEYVGSWKQKFQNSMDVTTLIRS